MLQAFIYFRMRVASRWLAISRRWDAAPTTSEHESFWRIVLHCCKAINLRWREEPIRSPLCGRKTTKFCPAWKEKLRMPDVSDEGIRQSHSITRRRFLYASSAQDSTSPVTALRCPLGWKRAARNHCSSRRNTFAESAVQTTSTTASAATSPIRADHASPFQIPASSDTV